MNPRPLIPDDMQKFLEYAKKQYKTFSDCYVNGTSCDDECEMEEEVKYYIGDSMEALLLFIEFLRFTNYNNGNKDESKTIPAPN